MAATKYQLLYRYINEATNTPIINSMENSYDEVCEFYTDPHHKIFSSDQQMQAEAVDEQQQMISFGNSAENPKVNMLFAYNGTKKIKHKQWVVKQTGYVVRDWQQLKRSNIGNEGDFTKEFTTLGAATPEDGGTVVCTQKVFNRYFPSTITVASDNSNADAGTSVNPFYTKQKIEKMIVESTIFALSTSGYSEHTSKSNTVYLQISYYSSKPVYVGPVAIEGNNMSWLTGYGGSRAYAQETDMNLYSRVTVSPSQVETIDIPGHYEDVTSSPYLIKDTYKRIQLSPWFVNSTYGSLDAALERAKTLVDMLGINNVKLIKIVPFDQYIKIK